MPVAKKTKEAMPKKIGGYKPTQVLGHGAMGNVWLCHDESLDRMVIVKQMVPTLLEQEAFIRRFQQEATILAHLNHPAIVVPYALWKESDGQLSLSMEFVMGKNLREILDACKQPPVWVVMAILYEIFLALSVVHRAGIVHRDLKPANMMVDKDGRIRLLDFGVAHMDKVYEDDPTLTMAGSQIENVFRGESLNQTLQNIRRLKIGKKAFPEGTPKQLVKLVMQLLEKKPSKRPLSAADVADELSRIMRAYPRDLTPYLSEWVTSAIKGEITAIEPKTYPNKCGKMTIVITALASAIATTVAFLLLTTL